MFPNASEGKYRNPCNQEAGEDPCVILRMKAECTIEYIRRKTDHFLLSKGINILQLPLHFEECSGIYW